MKTSAGEGLRLYRRLLGYVWPHWRLFLLASLGLGLVAASEAAFAALIKPMMDGSFVEKNPEIIRLTPIVLIVLFLVRGIAAFAASYGMAWISRQVIKSLRREMFHRLLHLPVAFFDNTPSGTLIAKMIYDVEQVARATTEVITILIRDTLTVIGLLGWMFYISWELALILLLGTPVIAKVITYINRYSRRYSSRVQTSMGEVTQIAGETIDGQRVVKTFGGQDYESTRFEQANEANRRLNMKFQATVAASVPVVQMIAAVASAAVIYFALLRLEELTVGTFVSFIASMMLLHSPIKRLTKVNVTLQRGMAAAESVFEFTDQDLERDAGNLEIGRSRGAVAYEQVGFRYIPEGERVLHDISFTIEPGQTVAFVGRSGGGKSTLVNLLPRFYDVSEGRITLDGHDIRELPLSELREQIALVSQHITLFNDSIAHNIAYGRLEGADRAAIERAAEQAHAMEFIRKLPEGLDTLVGENGVLLSGGQRQRLAIARALLKDAPILILDEATSALDTESERHIQAALELAMQNRTTLVIAHRLSTIEKADRIVVLDHGRIVEQGSHTELLARNGHYAALHRMQFREEDAVHV